MPHILDYRNQRLKDWVDNKEKSSETQSQPELTQRTRGSADGPAHEVPIPSKAINSSGETEARATGKPNQFTATQLQMEKHNSHQAQMNQRARTEPEAALGEKPRPPAGSSTAPLAWLASSTDRLLLMAGHSALT